MPIDMTRKICKLFGCLKNSIQNLNNSISGLGGLKKNERAVFKKSIFGTIKLLVYGFLTENVNKFDRLVSRLVRKFIQGIEEGSKAIPIYGSFVAVARIADTAMSSVSEIINAISSTLSGFSYRLKGMFTKKDKKVAAEIDTQMEKEIEDKKEGGGGGRRTRKRRNQLPPLLNDL